MFRPASQRLAARVLAAFVCTLLLALPPSATAQSRDTSLAPDRDSPGVSGAPQRVEADVGEDVRPSSVRLFYRFDAGEDYSSLQMRPTRDAPGVYAATVPASEVLSDRMEFHIVAERTDGAVMARGSANRPVVRELHPRRSSRPIDAPPGPSAEQPGAIADENTAGDATPPAERDVFEAPVPRKRSTFLYIALGAVALGAVVAASRASGGDDDDCPDGLCDLTVRVPIP